VDQLGIFLAARPDRTANGPKKNGFHALAGDAEALGHGTSPRRESMLHLELVQGDITEQRVDAIVNAANSSLLGGGGVDGAIHRVGGREILAECRALRQQQWPAGLPTGRAVATGAGRLPARWVIHTVGPVYATSADPAGELASCHRESLRVADLLGATSVAFPAISTGVYGYPPAEAAAVALAAVREARTTVRLVRFVLFSPYLLKIFAEAAARPAPPGRC
jgi:O-acetyl-ADP-ribose deacetylase (regulator of RNase III)